MKTVLYNITFSCLALLATSISLAQTKSIEIISRSKTSIQSITDLEVVEGQIAILSKDNLIFCDISGKILKKQKCEKSFGIGYDMSKKELLYIDDKSSVNNILKTKSLVLKSKNEKSPNAIKKKYIAIADSGYVSYIDEGWSSRLAFFNSSGEEVASIFAPGLGSVSGITFQNRNFWIISDLGINKKGIIRKYSIKETEITADEVIELSEYNTKGLAIDNSDYFYTYSEQNKEIVKFKIR